MYIWNRFLDRDQIWLDYTWPQEEFSPHLKSQKNSGVIRWPYKSHFFTQKSLKCPISCIPHTSSWGIYIFWITFGPFLTSEQKSNPVSIKTDKEVDHIHVCVNPPTEFFKNSLKSHQCVKYVKNGQNLLLTPLFKELWHDLFLKTIRCLKSRQKSRATVMEITFYQWSHLQDQFALKDTNFQ